MKCRTCNEHPAFYDWLARIAEVKSGRKSGTLLVRESEVKVGGNATASRND